MAVKTVSLTTVGRIELIDIKSAVESAGREMLPFPFAQQHPNRFGDYDAYAAYCRTVPDRFRHGDLEVFRKWLTSYTDADLRVECRVQYFTSSRRPTRIMAHRAGQLGFLAVQRVEDDTVDVYSLSPYELGAAIAGSVQFDRPGRHQQIVIPEYVPEPLRGPAAADGRSHKPTRTTRVASNQVGVYATVQSHWQPARSWGLDRKKDAAVWVRLIDDGDYLYSPDYRHAVPATRSMLGDRVDRLIAADIEQIRRARGR